MKGLFLLYKERGNINIEVFLLFKKSKNCTHLFYALACVYKKHMLFVVRSRKRSLELYLVKAPP